MKYNNKDEHNFMLILISVIVFFALILITLVNIAMKIIELLAR